jgi:hypothetical protein
MTSKDNLYGGFVDYYGDITLSKIKESDGWTVYGAKIKSVTNLNRYIFAVVDSDLYRFPSYSLNDLDWVSFQTRMTDEVFNVPAYDFLLDENKKKALKDKINIIERVDNTSIYVTPNLPIKIKLLHDPRKNNYLQYPDTALLYQALETYRCVIELL